MGLDEWEGVGVQQEEEKGDDGRKSNKINNWVALKKQN